MSRKTDFKQLDAEAIQRDLLRCKAPSRIALDNGVSLGVLKKFCLNNGIDVNRFKRRYTRMTDETKDRIREEAVKGGRIEEIAEKLDLTTGSVRAYLFETGYGDVSRKARLESRGEKLKKLVESGCDVAEICEKFDKSESTVRNWLHKADLKVKPKQRGRAKKKPVILFKPDSMAEQYWPKCKTCKYRGKLGRYSCCDYILIAKQKKKCIPTLGIYDSYVHDENPRRFN